MKISDLLSSGAPIVIKNINIINQPESKKDDTILNPGVEYGSDDNAKWAPPLQQELSVIKSIAGETPDADTTTKPEEPPETPKTDNNDAMVALLKKLSGIFD